MRLGVRVAGKLHQSPLEPPRTAVSAEGRCARLRDSDCSVVCCSDSGTFLGLGTVTGSVAIYIAFSLQVMGRGGHSPEGSSGWGLQACFSRECREESGPAYRGNASWEQGTCFQEECFPLSLPSLVLLSPAPVLCEGGPWHCSDGCGLSTREGPWSRAPWVP